MDILTTRGLTVQPPPAVPPVLPVGETERSGRSRSATEREETFRRMRADKEFEELRSAAARANIEVEFQTLEDSSTLLVRFVEPTSKQILKEFPPEAVAEAIARSLARALAELRAQASVRLDERA